MNDRVVIALGGNALGKTPKEQVEKVRHASISLVDLIEGGDEIVISHGNGPQVGMINLAFDEASKINNKIVSVELPECTAMSQGYIGSHLQNAVEREMHSRKLKYHCGTVVTQVEVSKDDPAFLSPSKPIGGFYQKEEAEKLMALDTNLVFKEDSGRGYRKVVASPKPIDIVEKHIIKSLLDDEYVVIACGGGGIPVIRDDNNDLITVPSVIDKDFASSKLAELVEADILVILTAVDRVCINFGKENQEEISAMNLNEASEYIEQGQFAAGSMLPKVKAAMEFVGSKDNRKAIIASLENASLALKGKSGTVISRY